MQSEETIRQLIFNLEEKNKSIRSGRHTITDPYEKDICVKTNKIWIQCLKWVLDGKSVGEMYHF